MNRYAAYADDELLPLLASGDSESFREIFKRYGNKMFRFIHSRVRDKEISEDMVQETFTNLWDKRSLLQIQSLNSYLFSSAKNAVLLHIRRAAVHSRYEAEFINLMAGQQDNSIDEALRVNDLKAVIESSIAQLPEYCQTAFRLSRYEHVPIAEIAERMNISKRTVENYITTTLKHLRNSLGEFMFLVWWLLG